MDSDLAARLRSGYEQLQRFSGIGGTSSSVESPAPGAAPQAGTAPTGVQTMGPGTSVAIQAGFVQGRINEYESMNEMRLNLELRSESSWLLILDWIPLTST